MLVSSPTTPQRSKSSRMRSSSFGITQQLQGLGLLLRRVSVDGLLLRLERACWICSSCSSSSFSSTLPRSFLMTSSSSAELLGGLLDEGARAGGRSRGRGCRRGRPSPSRRAQHVHAQLLVAECSWPGRAPGSLRSPRRITTSSPAFTSTGIVGAGEPVRVGRSARRLKREAARGFGDRSRRCRRASRTEAAFAPSLRFSCRWLRDLGASAAIAGRLRRRRWLALAQPRALPQQQAEALRRRLHLQRVLVRVHALAETGRGSSRCRRRLRASAASFSAARRRPRRGRRRSAPARCRAAERRARWSSVKPSTP